MITRFRFEASAKMLARENFRSFDAAGGGGSTSILDPNNRAFLQSKYGIKIISPVDLAASLWQSLAFYFSTNQSLGSVSPELF